MTNLELLQDLNRRHARLEVALSALKADLGELQNRLERPEFVPPTPPMPAFIPPIRDQAAPPSLPIVSVDTVPLPPLPEIPQAAPVIPPAPEPELAPESATNDSPGFELQFGRWLARIGVVFALFTLIFFAAVVKKDYYQYLGPWSKLSVLALVSGGLIAVGLRLEKRDSKMLVYGRTLAGGGLACLYYTLYGATYVPQLQVITSPLLGGILLLAWSAGVFWIAGRRKSELLSIFAISLAYFSSAITPGNGFTMAADLILALTAVIFLIRNAWSGLSYLCLVGTYAGFMRQAVIYEGPLDFQWTGHLPFWPSAVYLAGAWLIFTAGTLLSRTEQFVGGKRMAFLCLNNGALTGLLIVAAWLGDFHHMGGILGSVGGAFLGAYGLTRMTRPESRDVADAYLSQGLALATGGVAIAYSGVTRGLMITIESVFLVASGAVSRNLILRIGGAVTAFLGAYFLAGEIVSGNHYPWVLTFGGALAMLANAWLARREFWSEAREVSNGRWVAETTLHILLALGLLTVGIVFNASNDWIDGKAASYLALAALVLTASIYVLPLFELPPLAQVLLILAQIIAFVPPLQAPASQGMSLGSYAQPQWSLNIVALITMILATWWPRQKRIATHGWLTPLSFIYALAMVAFCYDSFHLWNREATPQTWMISAALLSLVFVTYGTWSRLWAFAASGQILLAMSVLTFLNLDNLSNFPWTWWAAAVPIAMVYATGWIAGKFLPRYAEADGQTALRLVARIYQSIALGLLIRWVFGVAPSAEITFALLALSAAFLLSGVFWRSSYAIRSGFVLSLAGAGHYLAAALGAETMPFTWMDAGAFALFLAQPALLRRWGRELISQEESWIVVLASSATAWIFVSNSVLAVAPQNLTLGWALFAVALTVVGFGSNERRQRWCGLVILLAAFVRVGVHDFWGFSDLYKVLTFFVLTVICLGLSFLYYKFADRLKEWL